MASRLSPLPVFRAHWRALSDYRGEGHPVPDRTTRATLITAPLLAGGAMFVWHGTLKGPDAVLAALALLAGGFLGAFALMAGVRSELTQREAIWGETERTDRDGVDETCAHLLAASYVSVVTAVLVVVGMNFAMNEHGAIKGVWAAISVACLTYLVMLALITFPRLYTAYATRNNVRAVLNGNNPGRQGDPRRSKESN